MNKIDERFFVNLGVEKGVDAIIRKHPRFKGRKNEIMQHLDLPRLKERVYEIYENLADKKISENKRKEYIVKELADYISTGIAFDDEGKEIILMKGLEEKAGSGFIRGYRARKMLRGEQYLDRGLALAHNLSYLMESGNYAEKMPEIAEAASTLEDMQLLDPLIKTMRQSGSLSRREYNFLQGRVYEQAIESENRIKSGIEKYVTSRKVAASILGILGMFLIAFSSRITGAVVGVKNNISSGIAGIILVIIAICMLLSSSKEKHKR